MGPQPGTEQRSKAFLRVHMNLMETIAVFITRVPAPAMTDRMMIKSPMLQLVIDGVFIGMDPRSGRNEGLDEGANRGLLDIFDHSDHNGTAALDHAEDRRLFRRQDPRPRAPFNRYRRPRRPALLTASGWPLWPAMTSTSSHSTSPERTGSGWRATTPSRHGSALR